MPPDIPKSSEILHTDSDASKKGLCQKNEEKRSDLAQVMAVFLVVYTLVGHED